VTRGSSQASRLGALCAPLLLLAACTSAPQQSPQASGPLEAIAPRGAADWPLSFSWKGASAGEVVRIRIFDDAERQVFGMEARGSTKASPAELKSILEAGAPYQWRVARVDANGEEADASALTPFSLR
jgi:hypothetical protein